MDEYQSTSSMDEYRSTSSSIDEDDYRSAIYNSIEECEFKGTFAVGGEINSNIRPIVTVDEVGAISFPCSKEQAAYLISKMEQAPFGKGFDTVIDTSVRKAWQIDASKVQIEQTWISEVLNGIVSEACSALGFNDQVVEAKLYKLLCYQEGGHFKKHRDTEKEPGIKSYTIKHFLINITT